MDFLFKNYSLNHVKDLESISEFGTVQLTLNHKVFPTKRGSVEMFRELCERFPGVKFICHYDFIYQVGKFQYFTSSVKKAVAEELRGLLELPCPNFLGVVSHVDVPYPRRVLERSDRVEYLRKSGVSPIFDSVNYINSSESFRVRESLSLSLYLLSNELPGGGKKTYLENTVRTDYSANPLDTIRLAILESGLSGSFGICLDNEHLFASNGLGLEYVNEFVESCSFPLLLHLNVVPSEVKPYSFLDKHSETTIFESGHNPYTDFVMLGSRLNELGIPWVREVKSSTRIREQEQLEIWRKAISH